MSAFSRRVNTSAARHHVFELSACSNPPAPILPSCRPRGRGSRSRGSAAAGALRSSSPAAQRRRPACRLRRRCRQGERCASILNGACHVFRKKIRCIVGVLLAACADDAAKVSSGGCCCARQAACSAALWEAVQQCCLQAEPFNYMRPMCWPACWIMLCPDGDAPHTSTLPALQASAQAALTGLVASVGGAASLDRPSRRAFGRVLSKFVTDMRGAVNVR